jgi:outer membrane receptor for ferrienterochelin and colicin
MGNGQYLPANYGTRNHFSAKNSFKYGIIGSNQDATGSPVGLVAAIIRRVPSAKKVSDRFGNASVSLRGRNSVGAAGDEVLWDIDGVTYVTPPMLSVNQVVYVEIIKGIAASNKYGSEGAGGVILVKTSVGTSKYELINSPRNLWRTVTQKKKRIKKN